MTQVAPAEPTPWPDTFAAGSAAAHTMPLRRPWDMFAEQEWRAVARRGRAARDLQSFEDRAVLLSQLPCSWVMLVPLRKVDCKSRPTMASLRAVH